ncbi:DUF4296 domain-containing protein [uncultured Kriegella sp.]|uniref:DUF4296 domain-containing protein n=1 Tax=uncultured Kriegella sp. TaxID=1798910 RepID=UPI0030D787BE|tara:strand:+ start:37633 stop:38067 length:435 start_codon:yes stop_codon:yes gene_type:complete
MSLNKILLFGFFTLFFSCNEKLIDKPENLIARDKMVEVLKDLALANAAKNTNIVVLRENDIEPTTYVFEKYGIDSIQFTQSDTYYASLPGGEYESIYTEVEQQLEDESKRLEEARQLNDSLAAAKKSADAKSKSSVKKIKDSLQ